LTFVKKIYIQAKHNDDFKSLPKFFLQIDRIDK